jgi:hypothetical protein
MAMVTVVRRRRPDAIAPSSMIFFYDSAECLLTCVLHFRRLRRDASRAALFSWVDEDEVVVAVRHHRSGHDRERWQHGGRHSETATARWRQQHGMGRVPLQHVTLSVNDASGRGCGNATRRHSSPPSAASHILFTPLGKR